RPSRTSHRAQSRKPRPREERRRSGAAPPGRGVSLHPRAPPHSYRSPQADSQQNRAIIDRVPDLHVVVLAAGKGTRMKSALPKVLHRVAGLPMIEHVLTAAASLRPRSTVVVVGYGADAVRAALAPHSDLTFVVQEPQL